MGNFAEIFGTNVFNEDVMKQRLDKDVYRALKKTIEEGNPLDISVANPVANAMKDWAIEKGATHYTHWFQPMTGVTAEKHDSFITPNGCGIIPEFTGKELIKGEPDASSFPSGGLRATFEARGYTAWDPTSYAFIKGNTLCIPTVFCSFSGETLDKKAPLLRSMDAINKQALRILKLFGKTDVKRVTTTVGPEQEYFLIDEDLFNRRPDLVFTGRTLFGAKPPKGQELDDHYFGAIKPRVAEFMKDLDEELWKLGILAKTEHNEVAPAQHELAPIFTNTNTATDHNQLTMETMKNVARRHGLVCLLHEKPFKGVNGSGKHNNWSLSTDSGINLLDPGKKPSENPLFLTFLVAFIKAVNLNQDLLRISVASAQNDHRLGGNEAPPSIVSMFLGDELTDILTSIENSTDYHDIKRSQMETGIETTPSFYKDTTDRNRTSPMAFTGNKFEFRMLGSSDSIACTNIMLNTAVADVLKDFADRLENTGDFKKDLTELLKNEIKQNKRIIFNGDGYSEEWVKEAKKRGLSDFKTTVDAIPHFADKKNIELFARHGIYTETEILSRSEILLEKYVKTVHIEVLTLIGMVNKDILPSVSRFLNSLCETAIKKGTLLGVDSSYEKRLAKQISALQNNLFSEINTLKTKVETAENNEMNLSELSRFYCDKILTEMEKVRNIIDALEVQIDSKFWPFPTYSELLFKI